MLAPVTLAEAFATIDAPWTPLLAGMVNDTAIRLVKLEGEFVWHRHLAEDELFLVIRGSFVMRFREGEVRVSEGEFLIVPRGVEHSPVAAEECWVMLIEPASTERLGD